MNTWLCVVEVTSKFMSFFLYGIPSIFRSLRATKIFRFMNMSQYAATPSIILNYNWSHLFNGIVSPIISPQSSYAECSFEMWVERLHTFYMKCQCSRISIYKKEIAQKYDITICYDKTVRYWYGYNLKNKYPNGL